jgi:hypothetical protein
VEAYPGKLPQGSVLQRLLGELAEALTGGSTPAGGQEQWTNQPRGAVELYTATGPGTIREEDALVLQERDDARDLPGFVLARLQSALLKQHKVSHYRNPLGIRSLEAGVLRSSGLSLPEVVSSSGL